MGILDAPGLSPAIAGKLYGRRLIAVSDNAFPAGSAANSQTATGGFTTRVPHLVPNDVTDLRLVFSNFYVAASTFLDTDNPNQLTVKAAIEVAGVIYPVTLNGSKTALLDGGGVLMADPLAVEIPGGTIIYSRTYAAGTTYYPNHGSFSTLGFGGRVAGDSTYSGSIPNNGAYGFSPAAILGTTTDHKHALLVAGDSIADGVGDRTGGQHSGVSDAGKGGGFILRAMRTRCGIVSIAQSSELATGFAAQAGHFRRMAMSRFATHATIQYGRNDVTASHSLATTQADLLTIWNLFKRRGLKSAQTTITPVSTSPDGWATPGNQTPGVNESVRTALNDWLRDGAPLAAGAIAAVGATGPTVARCAYYSATDTLVSAASGPTHPLVAVLEVADTVESARNSSKWKATGRVVTDAAFTSGSNTLTSATANFTSADVGTSLYLPGAGTSGALVQTYVSALISPTQVGTDFNATTTVSGITATIGGATLDGTHPSPTMYASMAAALPVAWMNV